MSDLTADEQVHVRTALRFLQRRCGGWAPLAKALRFKERTLAKVASGRTVSASMACRVARLGGVTIDDVITGRYPAPGACPCCGHHEAQEGGSPTNTQASPEHAINAPG